jgi:LAS superfamily LD-carboxypeptidase LdcB
MLELTRKKAKRSIEGKKSLFRVNKKPVEDRKINRYLQRNGISEEQLLEMTSPINGK